ncbi:hypothetical protein C2845_PM15G20470 [Panicum miliaceum]|uniref:DUF674 family protein n=1 Tax=Panicum miliaceum TaxID=4540 RepID=A0A3L6Q964_PANMI|nr:hypothetical protein C2845_PM15G20470 [Panicum miliaceum]
MAGKIRVKFLVDNEKRKVVFAESGKEFVDVLLSFLTLPLGTIVRLLGKESSLGCFDELYKSVESLDASPSALPGRCARISLSGLTTPTTRGFGFAASIKVLLKQSLKSDQPLTDLMFGPSDEPARTNEPLSVAVKVSSENGSSSDCDVLRVKLLVTKTDQSVVHAEVPEEFCNILFSLLTLPLGRVIKLLGGSSSISSINNLYKSAGEFMTDYIKSNDCQDMVLYHELPPFFSCSNPLLLQSDEEPPIVSSVACCSPCIRECSPLSFEKMKCSHGNTKLLAVNPKVPTMTTETGGGYAKGPGKFLVLNLLRAALLSREALTLVCWPTKSKRRPHH